MESEWRLNVARLGMTHSDWELAASIREAPEFYVVKRTGLLPHRYFIAYVPDPDQPPFTGQVEFIAPPGIPFPYGWQVFPD